MKPVFTLLLALVLPATTLAADPAAPAADAKTTDSQPADAAADQSAPAGDAATTEGGAAAPPPPPKPREPFDPGKLDQRDADLLAASVSAEDEVLWLEAGGQKFLALFQSAAKEEANGAVILLHDSGENPIWPEAIEAVRRTLPAHGWHTLAIALPTPVPPAVPERSLPVYTPPAAPPPEGQADGKAPAEGDAAATDKAAEPAPAQEQPAADKPAEATAETPPAPPQPEVLPPPKPLTTAEVEAIADARLEAAWDLFKSKGYKSIVLVGAGSGAERMLRLSKTHPFGPSGATTYVSAVVMITPPSPSLAGLRDIQGAALPILEIFHSPGEVVEREMAYRKRSAKRYHLSLYDQVLLPAPQPNMTGDEDRLAKRLRAWLFNATESARVYDKRLKTP